MQTILLSQIIPNLHLDIISSHSDSFSIMHWQCEADIKIENRTLVINNDQFDNKALDFVRLAKEKNASLALTPEYSFPWELLNKIIENPDMHPTAAKLWCFGMQYITLSDFELWCHKHNSVSIEDSVGHSSLEGRAVTIIFDGFQERKQFANVLVYLFINTDDKLTVLIQSKLRTWVMLYIALKHQTYL